MERKEISSLQKLFLSIAMLFITNAVFAQYNWPIAVKDGTQVLNIYKPEVESFTNTSMEFKAAISIDEGTNVPVFGAIWVKSSVKNNTSTRKVTILDAKVQETRFPDGSTLNQAEISTLIENAFRSENPELSMDDILLDLESVAKEKEFAGKMNNNPPKIIYTDKPSILVNIDGAPVVEITDTKDIETVTNTPFLIVKHKNVYYLGNGDMWYSSSSATANYKPLKSAPKAVKKFAESARDKNQEELATTEKGFYPEIIVATEPTELIQTNGEPGYTPINGTNLLYVSNSEDELIMDVSTQKYYLLLSGRWFTANSLKGGWKFIESDNLPADFAKIPEGNDKDAVLANVPGTRAAKEAVYESQVPQTAIVDRSKATSEVVYDGDPIFEGIEGTNLRLASNSANTVIVEDNRYFLVDDGVWFVASSPRGPWVVSDYRPAQVTIIPPSSPAYNVRYVKIYHSTPSVVYVGYTRGYLSSYVVGGTVVYGTGYHYRPWRGAYYYPRPYTWGFGMVYSPWTGWSVNLSYGIGGYGWLSYHGYYHNHYYRPGWWGPAYRPYYRPPYTHYYGRVPARYRPIRYSSSSMRPNYTTSRPRSVYSSRDRSRDRVGVVSTRPTSGRIVSNSRDNYTHSARPTQLRPGASRPNNNSSTRPNTGSSRPNSGSSRPNTGSSRPNTGSSTRPNTGTSRPNTGTRPNTETTRPNTGSSRPNTGTSRPNNNESTRPNTGNSRPNTGTSRPNTSTGSGSSRPNTETTRPNTGSTRPNTSTGSGSTTTRPNTSTSRPNTSTGSGSSTRPNTSTSRPTSSRSNAATTRQTTRTENKAARQATRSQTSSSRNR